MATVNIGYLLPFLRLEIGDTNPETYRYTNDWLLVSLQASMKALARWWRNKYLLDTSNAVYRNHSTGVLFLQDEPPVIEIQDERPIILMASLIVLEGSLENTTWDLASWRDNEISFTNLDSGRIKDLNLTRRRDELLSLMKPPTKKLARIYKGSLPGYRTTGSSKYESEGEF